MGWNQKWLLCSAPSRDLEVGAMSKHAKMIPKCSDFSELEFWEVKPWCSSLYYRPICNCNVGLCCKFIYLFIFWGRKAAGQRGGYLRCTVKGLVAPYSWSSSGNPGSFNRFLSFCLPTRRAYSLLLGSKRFCCFFLYLAIILLGLYKNGSSMYTTTATLTICV